MVVVLVSAGVGGWSLDLRRRFLQFRAILAGHDRINSMIFVGAVQGQLETLGEQGLQHFRDLLFRRARRHFRENIETVDGNPGRTSDLIRLYLVGRANHLG